MYDSYPILKTVLKGRCYLSHLTREKTEGQKDSITGLRWHSKGWSYDSNTENSKPLPFHRIPPLRLAVGGSLGVGHGYCGGQQLRRPRVIALSRYARAGVENPHWTHRADLWNQQDIAKMHQTVVKRHLREILFQAERKQVWRHEDMKVYGMCEGLFMKLKINALLD